MSHATQADGPRHTKGVYTLAHDSTCEAYARVMSYVWMSDGIQHGVNTSTHDLTCNTYP